MKTKEELNALKEEVEALRKKLMDLSEEDLAEFSGGLIPEMVGPVKDVGVGGGCPYSGDLRSLMNCPGCRYASY